MKIYRKLILQVLVFILNNSNSFLYAQPFVIENSVIAKGDWIQSSAQNHNSKRSLLTQLQKCHTTLELVWRTPCIIEPIFVLRYLPGNETITHYEEIQVYRCMLDNDKSVIRIMGYCHIQNTFLCMNLIHSRCQ